MGSQSEFEKASAGHAESGLLAELWEFLAHNKKWWMLPILAILLLMAALALLSGSAAAPFIYTLF
jgi:hypothetical protein